MVNYWKLALIFLIVLAAAKISLFNVNSNNYYWDEAVYLDLAKNIRESKGYSSSMDENFRAPLFPMMLSLMPNLNVAHFFMALLFLASMLLAYLLAKELLNRQAGIIAAILMATNPLYYFWSYKLLTEPLTLCLVLASLYFYAKYDKDKEQKYLYMSFFTAGLAMLARYTSITLIGALILDISIKKRMLQKHSLIAVAVLLIALTPLFMLGMENYGNPLGMLVQNSLETANPEMPIASYAQNALYNLGYFVPILFLFALIPGSRKKIPNVLWYYLALTAALLISVSQKYERFLIILLPAYAVISAIGFAEISRSSKKLGSVLLIGIILISSAITYYIIRDVLLESRNTEILLDAANFVKQSGCEGMISNSTKHFSFFAGKKTAGYPATEQEFLKLAEDENISCFAIDSFHGLPTYRKFINDTYKIIYANSSDNKFVYVYTK